jgi:hypothetical protein
VAADKTRLERHEIPLGSRGCEDIARIDIERLEYQRQLVHEGDVQVALAILDDLRSLPTRIEGTR